MYIKRGIKLLEEAPGTGRQAQKGDDVVYNLRIFLNKGDEVLLNEAQAERMPERLAHMIRRVDGRPLINHTVRLGRREAMAGVEYTLMAMRAGGYRKVQVSPHLAYRDKGVPGLIPADAVLVLELWLREVRPDAG
jgi:hypothetical protein